MNSKGKNVNKINTKAIEKKPPSDLKQKPNDETLQRMAVEEIIREIKLKSIRANEIGPSGWLDYPVKRTNKRFLCSTLKAAITHNTRKMDRAKFESEKKLLEMEYEKHPTRKPKFGDRKILFKKPESTKTECRRKAV